MASDSMEINYLMRCPHCGAPQQMSQTWTGSPNNRELKVERSFMCGHKQNSRSEHQHQRLRHGSEAHNLRRLAQNFLRSAISNHTLLSIPINMAVRLANSNESLASQIPLSYHLTQGEVHSSPVNPNFSLPAAQLSIPWYQQESHVSYNPSPLNLNFGIPQQIHQPQQHFGSQSGPQTDRIQAYQQSSYHYPAIRYPQQGQESPQMIPSHGYPGYQQTSISRGRPLIQQYGDQGGVMTLQQPYHKMTYDDRRLDPQSGHQNMYRSDNNELHNQYAPNLGPIDRYHSSTGYEYEGLHHNHHNGTRSIFGQSYGSGFENPPDRSSGFPGSVVQNQQYMSQNFQAQSLGQSQTRNFQAFVPQQGQLPWGRHYESRRNQVDDSVGSSVGSPQVGLVQAVGSQQSISPRAAPATDPLPGKSRIFGALTGSPVKRGATPPRGDIIHVSTPPTTTRVTDKPTPHLRSRKGQSVSGLKIDPARGPPPAFWPAIGQPGPSSLVPTPSAYQTYNENFATGNSGLDPFTAGGYTFPQEMFQTVPQLTLNPFDGTQAPHAVPLAPLVIPQQQPQGPSPHLAAIAPNSIQPAIEVALDARNLPFIETARISRPANHGVVRISNIPYSITRAEIVAFLGRNARIIKEDDEPVHIIMERVTSKTMEAFVEFTNISEAVSAVNRYEVNRHGGRSGRLGERHVDLEVSGQENLMAELFPKARNVCWVGAKPQIIPRNPDDPYNSGFQGFVSSEELVMLIKHVEAPQRSPFSKECPQRPFECLISTLVKFPWYMVDHITLEDRDQLYTATRDLVQNLVSRLDECGNDEISPSIHINERLLRRLRMAAFNCPGFTECQKDDIAFICGLQTPIAGLTEFPHEWTVFYTIGPKPGIARDVLNYYVALLREATTSSAVVSLAERAARDTQIGGELKYFGNVMVHYPENVKKMALGDIAVLEWNVIEMLLRQRLQVDN